MANTSGDSSEWPADPGASSELFTEAERALDVSEVFIREQSAVEGGVEMDVYLPLARRLVRALCPVPPIIWRLTNFAIGRAGKINQLTPGHVFGLKRLMLRIADDKTLGAQEPCANVHDVLKRVSSDRIAALSVMYAVVRRLETFPFKRLWGPMLEEALVRASLGFCVGEISQTLGVGRSMLAGFAGRIGIVVLIATGDERQAHRAVAALAQGADLQSTAREIFECDPSIVSAMILSAAGCGRDGVLGIGAFGLSKRAQSALEPSCARWLAALNVTECAINSSLDSVSETEWQSLGFDVREERDELRAIAAALKRNGHAWSWLYDKLPE